MSVFKNFQSELIDLSYLLEASEGDEEFIKMMLNSFLLNTPTYLEDLDRLLIEKNYRGLHSCAHKFKGTVAIVGVSSLQQLLGTFEKVADTYDDMKLSELLEEIKDISKKVLTEMNTLFN